MKKVVLQKKKSGRHWLLSYAHAVNLMLKEIKYRTPDRRQIFMRTSKCRVYFILHIYSFCSMKLTNSAWFSDLLSNLITLWHFPIISRFHQSRIYYFARVHLMQGWIQGFVNDDPPFGSRMNKPRLHILRLMITLEKVFCKGRALRFIFLRGSFVLRSWKCVRLYKM